MRGRRDESCLGTCHSAPGEGLEVQYLRGLGGSVLTRAVPHYSPGHHHLDPPLLHELGAGVVDPGHLTPGQVVLLLRGGGPGLTGEVVEMDVTGGDGRSGEIRVTEPVERLSAPSQYEDVPGTGEMFRLTGDRKFTPT